MDIKDVTVVVCTRNNKKNIGPVVKSIKREDPGEIIVVDGNSTDGTREIIDKMGVTVLTDPGKGLALARQIALNEVMSEFVMFVGDDNLIKKGSILRLKKYLIEHNWAGAALQTRIWKSQNDYWSYCSNWRWKLRFYEGERDVIGTPYMYYTELLKRAGYDEKCSVSDDSDIDNRLSKITDKKFGYSNVICYEIGKTGLSEITSRYMMYGKSDSQFWNKYSVDWTLKRKWKSICHPIYDELISPIKKIEDRRIKIWVFPYFLFITVVRYVGWIRCMRKR